MTERHPRGPRRADARGDSGWRDDINGLRAVAVVPVVAFHAGVAQLPGGFVGVDVFYVISGFLITTILVREIDSTGTIRLGAFWTKRLRRLAPALALVVAVTAVACLFLLSPVRWVGVGVEAIASLLSVSNLLFASRATDYFAEGSTPSPLLHTWSLGVEEQFYLLWPLLLVVTVRLALRAGRRPRVALAAVFAATTVGSFALSVWWSSVEPSWAFYVLPTRAWEFAIAGLIALAPLERLVRPRPAAVLSWLGLGLLGLSFVAIDSDVPFPGSIALVPVLGTVLVIVGGSRIRGVSRPLVSRVLGVPALQWIGTRSYSWYLWHWPLIVLAALAFPVSSAAGSTAIACAAAVASLGAAAFSHRFVETPIRFHDRLVGSARRTVAVVGSVTAAALVVGGSVVAAGVGVTSAEPYRTFAAVLSDVPDQSCVRQTESPSGVPICELGDVDADRTIMLVGDSHAGHWKRAMHEAAAAEGVRLVVRWRSSCPAIPVRLLDTRGAPDGACDAFQRETLDLLAEVRPDAVVLSQSAAYGRRILSPSGDRIEREERLEQWRLALDAFLADVEAAGAEAAVVLDNPRLDFDPIDCLSRLGAEREAEHEAEEEEEADEECVSDRDEALEDVGVLNAIGRETADSRGEIALLDVTEEICDAEHCFAEREGVPVFRDDNHLSEVWTRTRVDDLRGWLSALVS